MSKKPDPNKYPIHVSRSSNQTIYLCGDKLQYTPPPIKLMDDAKWHNERPLCKGCANEHFALYGEVIQWPPKQ